MIGFPKKFMPCLSIECRDAMYPILRIAMLRICNNLQTAKYAVFNLERMCSICFFYSYNDYRFEYWKILYLLFLHEFICKFVIQWSMQWIYRCKFYILFLSVLETTWLAWNYFIKMRLCKICSLCSYHHFPRHLCHRQLI